MRPTQSNDPRTQEPTTVEGHAHDVVLRAYRAEQRTKLAAAIPRPWIVRGFPVIRAD